RSRQAVFVDALSGKDGHSLWWWRSDEKPGITTESHFRSASNGLSTYISRQPTFQVTALRLWSAGADGWPKLVVPYSPDATAVLSTGSGRLQQKIADQDLVQVADLDRDGIDDLVFRTPQKVPLFAIRDTLEIEQLSAIRGTLPEIWRRLGNWQPAEDLDGDGVRDLLNCDLLNRDLPAISGRDGHVIWRPSGPQPQRVALHPAHNDLDGDGTPDFLSLDVNSRKFGDGNRVPIDLRAISGKTGKQIWSAEHVVVEPEKGQASRSRGSQTQAIACHDLSGDGQLELVLIYDLMGRGHIVETHQLWLAVLSRRDGKALWRQALTDEMPSADLPQGLSCQPGIADLDGDGVLDLVIAVPVPPKERPGIWGSELRALSGRDGKLLWRRPLPAPAANTELKNAVSVPAIGDVSSNGKPQVVVLTQSWRSGDKDATSYSAVAEVLCFDGRTGEPLWNHQHKFQHGLDVQPHVLLTDGEGNGKVAVYAAVGRLSGDGILLDAHGHLQPAEMPIYGLYDLAGDGKKELLLFGNNKLRVTRGGIKNIVWERSGIDRPREVLPGNPGQPATVVAEAGKSILGLDGATGKPLWRCPIRDAGSILPDREPRAPPWLISHADGSTICRRARATTADGDYAPAAGTPRTAVPLPDDPRIVRPMPWVDLMAGTYDAPVRLFPRIMTGIIGGSIFVSIFVLTLLVCAVQRRWRSLAAWLAVFLMSTVAIAIFLLTVAASWVGPMDPMEHYTLSGWYQVAYYGVSIAGALVPLWFIVLLVWRMLRWTAGRILARTRVS
ncbi:MAG: PQQ-binding-like beta-propeller repeat protein, partial [Thermoguttaceae bacterium]